MLNQVKQQTYSDGTPSVTYTYGASGNSNGQLTSVSNENSTTNYTNFDVMGRVLASNQVTQGQTYSFSYNYNLAGALTSETYPSGRTITTSYDAVNRPVTVQGNLQGQSKTYVSGVGYAAHGGVGIFTEGNNVVPVYTYNNRLQVNEYWATIGNDPNHFLSHVIPNWGGTNNDGNLLSVQEGYGPNVSWSALSWLQQNYSYDGVNRLSSVSDSGYSRSFCYDAYGNGWVTQNSGVVLAGNTPQELGAACTNSYNTPYNPINNHIVGASYDAAGNQTGVNGNTVAYDAESRQISVAESPSYGGGTETYVYDGVGQRVSKSGPGGTTVYVYDALGQLAAEYSTAINSSPCSTCYLAWDHLGTPRLITDQNGNVVSWHDYLPFGEEIPGGTAGRSGQFGVSDGIATKFTGQYRDHETALDFFGARYYGSALGRFASPDDPLVDQDPRNPQSWNLYSYVRNNPLSNVDPSGNDCITTSDQTDTSVTVTVASGSCDGNQGAYVPGTVDINSLTYNGTSISYGYNPYDPNSLSGYGTVNLGPAIDDSLSPDVAMMLNQAGNMASPFVNAAGAGLMAFGSLVAPLPMAIAQCGAGNCDKANLAMAVIPEGGAAQKLTRWGWTGTRKFLQALKTLREPGTHETLEGIVPTIEEAKEMIESAGGTIDRIEPGHAPGGISPHTYDHINYTTPSGSKATVKVQP